MTKRVPSKDDALEALDFIVSVLKEHEKDLDRLITELGTITEHMGDTGELSSKVEKVEEKLGTLQDEITNLISYLSTAPASHVPVPQTGTPQTSSTNVVTKAVPIAIDKDEVKSIFVKETRGPPVILRCKHWEDFLTLANEAQTVSFMYRETEKTFQADALKGNQIVTYSGELPKYPPMLKTWLATQLNVPENRILEGVLAIG